MPSAHFRWLADPKTLKKYHASAEAERGFCAECGSMIYWRKLERDKLSIAVGTVDPLYLFGEGADGVEVPREGFGRALASGLGQADFTGNEISGVTDDMPLLNRGRRSVGDGAQNSSE